LSRIFSCTMMRRMKFGSLLIALGLCGFPGYGTTSQHPTPIASSRPAAAMESKAAAGQQPAGAPPTETHYVLTPEKRAKAITYSRAQYLLYFASIALSLAIYGFFWRIGFAAVLREWVRRVSRDSIPGSWRCTVCSVLSFKRHGTRGEPSFGHASVALYLLIPCRVSCAYDNFKGFAIRLRTV
jgi:hypothetical protein